MPNFETFNSWHVENIMALTNCLHWRLLPKINKQTNKPFRLLTERLLLYIFLITACFFKNPFIIMFRICGFMQVHVTIGTKLYDNKCL